MAIRYFKGTNVIFALVVLLILVLLFWPTKPAKGPTKTTAPKVVADTMPAVPTLLAERYKSIAGAVDVGNIKKDIDVLASYPSRMVGYPGCEQAADYVEKRFREIGLEDITTEDFRVTVPVDEGSRIDIDGQSFPIYSLWPNLVRTSHLPPEGLEVHVIDGGGEIGRAHV